MHDKNAMMPPQPPPLPLLLLLLLMRLLQEATAASIVFCSVLERLLSPERYFYSSCIRCIIGVMYALTSSASIAQTINPLALKRLFPRTHFAQASLVLIAQKNPVNHPRPHHP